MLSKVNFNLPNNELLFRGIYIRQLKSLNLYAKFLVLTLLSIFHNLSVFGQCNPIEPSSGCVSENLCFQVNSPGYASNVTWDFGDGKSALKSGTNLNDQQVYRATGIYTAKLIPDYTPLEFQLKCIDTAIQNISVGTCVLNTPTLANGNSAYPNPTKGKFTLRLAEGTQLYSYKVLDLSGKEVNSKKKDLGLESFEIELTICSPRIYQLQITTN